MKLITELFDDIDVITEANEDGSRKSHFIEGIFMQGDLKNRNGRMYPSQTLEKEMRRYDEQFIKTKRALGELNHPTGPQVNPERASHLIVNMRRENSNFIGKAKILSTPMGKLVEALLVDGVKIGVSTRGLGSVKSVNGIMEVQDDFHLATVDIVTDPSGPDCFVNGIMEGTEFFYNASEGTYGMAPAKAIEEIKEEVKRTVTRTVRHISEAQATAMFRKFVASLSENTKPGRK